MSRNSRQQQYRGRLITYLNANSKISEEFRTIRTNIKFLAGRKEKNIILITSPDSSEGKSMIAANLAVSIAQQKEKILLIDANLRHPVIHNMFTIRNRIGLTDLLTNKATFYEAVYQTHIGRLDILTSGTTELNPTELLESTRMTELLNKVENYYSMVIIDSPPIIKSTETRVLANQCDGVILVVNRKRTKLEKIAESRKLLELVDAKIIGSIINEK